MKKILLTAFTIVLVASCTKRNELLPGDNPNEIVFGSSIEVETKRTDDATAFDNGEVIGVYTYCRDAAGAIADFTKDIFMNNVKFTYNGTQFTSTPAIMWRDSKVHNFYAYYPTTLTPTNSATGATVPLTVVAATGISAANDVMTAKVETPVYDGTQNSANLKFKHLLSKVRFKIMKESTTTLIDKLTKVEFKTKYGVGSVNIMEGTVTNTAGSVKLSKDLSATPVAIPATTPVDVPASWMVLPDDVISDIILFIDGQEMQVKGTLEKVQTKAGKITTITVTVKGSGVITFTSSIEPWGADNLNTDEMNPTFTPMIEYCKAPYNLVGTSLKGATTTTHNTKSGAGATNGAYQANATDAFLKEKPYCKFEIAKTDAYAADGTKNWTVLQGSAADHSDNICVKTHGDAWRLPRLSEMQLIWENRVKLNAFAKGFVAIVNANYWVATESSAGFAWYIGFSNGASDKMATTTATARVRCIREIRPTPGPVIEYGRKPYNLVGAIATSVTASYNSKSGEGTTTNGMRYTTESEVYTGEPPYYKFEVAMTDAYDGTSTQGWRALQGTAADHNDNICVLTHGAGWRLPRLSELKLMAENRVALSASGNGFTRLADGGYWSATESSADNAWSVPFSTGTPADYIKTTTNFRTRCVRELP